MSRRRIHLFYCGWLLIWTSLLRETIVNPGSHIVPDIRRVSYRQVIFLLRTEGVIDLYLQQHQQEFPECTIWLSISPQVWALEFAVPLFFGNQVQLSQLPLVLDLDSVNQKILSRNIYGCEVITCTYCNFHSASIIPKFLSKSLGHCIQGKFRGRVDINRRCYRTNCWYLMPCNTI